MRVDQFWNSWTRAYKRLWLFVAGVFIATLAFFWLHRYDGASGVTQWIRLQEQKVIDNVIHAFTLGPFRLTVPAESYVIFEYLHGSDIVPNTLASYVFLVVLAFGSAVLLAAISTLRKFWYLIGMGFFILFMVSLRLEVLGLFGLYTRVVDGVAIGAFAIVSYYFNSFRVATSFNIRLLVFCGIWTVIGGLIAVGAEVNYPFYHLTLTGYASGMVITILFATLVAHEIIAGLVYLVSQNRSHNLRHFAIIATVYMANVIITCLHELGAITWSFVYIDVYLLLTVSAILGLWGFRQRETQYSHIFIFAPVGAFGYLALGMISFATIGQLLANWNDPALRVVRDAIIFSHTGYGIIFLVYIFSNFIYLLARNLPVDKVLYNPTRMPYFTFRFAGFIAMLAFVFYSNWREYVFHAMAGFYNTTGDLYSLMENELYAESFYEQGALQAFQNNRSNYALGNISAGRLNFETAHYQYQAANGKRPTPYSLVNNGNVYIWEGDAGAAVEAYRLGYTRLNGSPALANNLGFAHAKEGSLDSALQYLNVAREKSLTKVSAETNFMALAALKEIPLNADSVLDLFGSEHPAVLANAIALTSVTNQDIKHKIDPLSIGRLDLYSATLLNNYTLKFSSSLDTTFIDKAYQLASDSLNSDFSESLKASLAFAYYRQGNVARALEILAELVYITQSHQGKFNYTMGLWALEQGNPSLASRYFSFADTYDYKEARFYNAIALSEAGAVQQARIAWDSVTMSQRGELHAIALQMKKILSISAGAALQLNDTERYQYCRYRIGLADSLEMNRLVAGFENNDYKAQALLDISKKYYEAGLLLPAIRYFRQVGGLELTQKELYDEIRHFELHMLAQQRDFKRLAEQINEGVTFDHGQQLEKMLFTALLAEVNGDVALAEKNYRILASWNPYLEEGIIAAADFYRKHGTNKLRPYAILAEAIQINTNSVPLYQAYIKEATRLEFDDYAAGASQRLEELKASLNKRQ